MTTKTTRLASTYVDMYEASGLQNEVTKAEYRLILRLFNSLLRQSVLQGGIYKLPYSVGILHVYYKIFKSKALDYQHYKETGEKRNFTNLHTEANILRIGLKMVENSLFFHTDMRRAFRFKPCRDMSRDLAVIIKGGYSLSNYIPYETYFD